MTKSIIAISAITTAQLKPVSFSQLSLSLLWLFKFWDLVTLFIFLTLSQHQWGQENQEGERQKDQKRFGSAIRRLDHPDVNDMIIYHKISHKGHKMVSGAFELLLSSTASAEGLVILLGCKRVFSKKVNRRSEGYSDVIVTIYIVEGTEIVLFWWFFMHTLS